MNTIRVKIVPNRELFRDDDTGFKIYSADVREADGEVEYNNYGNISVKGDNLPDFNIGSLYDIDIAKNPRDKYKGSYSMVKSHYVKPQTAEEQWKFLSMIVTENQYVSISRVYSADEDKIIDIITNDEFDYERVDGYGEITYNSLKEKVKLNMDVSEALAYFSEYEVSYNLVKRLVSKYGSAEVAIKEVEKNPYSIVEKDGFGFIMADELAMKLGIPKDSPHRIRTCMEYVLDEISSNGDIWLNRKKLYNKMKKLLKIKKPEIEAVMDEENENVFCYGDRYATMRNARNEMRLAFMLSKKILKEEPLLSNHDYDPDGFIERFEDKNKVTLSDQQKEFLYDINKTNLMFLIGNAGSGKAQPVDTVIPTPEGYRKMGDIKVGDFVFDREGNPTEVLGVYPQGKIDEYEVTLSDGRKTYSNDEHLWSYYTSRGNLKTKSLREMIDIGIINEQIDKRTGRVRRNSRFKIPTNGLVKFNNKSYDLEVDPYVLGSFIGDGSLTSKNLTLCSNDEFVVKKVSKILGFDYFKASGDNYNWNFRYKNPKRYKGGNNQSIARYTVFTEDVFPKSMMNISLEKNIPVEYKLSSSESRFKLLQGLFDTDGSIMRSKGRYSVSYSTASKTLACDIQELLRSLGMNGTIYEDVRDGRNTVYEISVLIENDKKKELFTLPRKRDIADKAYGVSKYRDYDRISIISATPTGNKKDMVCFYVDNPEHLYLTNDYIVTHNTFVQKSVIELADELGLSYALLSPTGKASRVLKESTGREAYTIHKKIGFGGFEEVESIPEDIILVDEASMADINIATKLMSVVRDGRLVIFIGDDAQIPSVGEGNFLYDCINFDKTPMVKLDKIFRQKESGMLDAITRTRKGRAFLNTTTVNNQRLGNNFEFRHMMKEQIVDNLLESYEKMLSSGHTVEEIGVLTPTNIGDVGTIEINRQIQERVNPQGGTYLKDEHTFGNKGNERTLRVGDYVMNTENMYDATVTNKAETINVFNGECGTIIVVNENSKEIIVDFEGNHVLFSFSEAMKKLSHAWAISIHKSQGSQYKIVLIVVDSSATYQLNLNLLYTAMSRAQDYLGVFGQARTYNRALHKLASFSRNSFLNEFLDISYKIIEDSEGEIETDVLAENTLELLRSEGNFS